MRKRQKFLFIPSLREFLLTTKQTSAEWKLKFFEMKKFLLMSFTFSDTLKLSDSVNDVAMTREFLYCQRQGPRLLEPLLSPPPPPQHKVKSLLKGKVCVINVIDKPSPQSLKSRKVFFFLCRVAACLVIFRKNNIVLFVEYKID